MLFSETIFKQFRFPSTSFRRSFGNSQPTYFISTHRELTTDILVPDIQFLHFHSDFSPLNSFIKTPHFHRMIHLAVVIFRYRNYLKEYIQSTWKGSYKASSLFCISPSYNASNLPHILLFGPKLYLVCNYSIYARPSI